VEKEREEAVSVLRGGGGSKKEKGTAFSGGPLREGIGEKEVFFRRGRRGIEKARINQVMVGGMCFCEFEKEERESQKEKKNFLSIKKRKRNLKLRTEGVKEHLCDLGGKIRQKEKGGDLSVPGASVKKKGGGQGSINRGEGKRKRREASITCDRSGILSKKTKDRRFPIANISGKEGKKGEREAQTKSPFHSIGKKREKRDILLFPGVMCGGGRDGRDTSPRFFARGKKGAFEKREGEKRIQSREKRRLSGLYQRGGGNTEKRKNDLPDHLDSTWGGKASRSRLGRRGKRRKKNLVDVSIEQRRKGRVDRYEAKVKRGGNSPHKQTGKKG